MAADVATTVAGADTTAADVASMVVTDVGNSSDDKLHVMLGSLSTADFFCAHSHIRVHGWTRECLISPSQFLQ